MDGLLLLDVEMYLAALLLLDVEGCIVMLSVVVVIKLNRYDQI